MELGKKTKLLLETFLMVVYHSNNSKIKKSSAKEAGNSRILQIFLKIINHSSKMRVVVVREKMLCKNIKIAVLKEFKMIHNSKYNNNNNSNCSSLKIVKMGSLKLNKVSEIK